MAIFKCEICGGTLEPENETVAVCRYCGVKHTLPKSDENKERKKASIKLIIFTILLFIFLCYFAVEINKKELEELFIASDVLKNYLDAFSFMP